MIRRKRRNQICEAWPRPLLGSVFKRRNPKRKKNLRSQVLPFRDGVSPNQNEICARSPSHQPCGGSQPPVILLTTPLTYNGRFANNQLVQWVALRNIMAGVGVRARLAWSKLIVGVYMVRSWTRRPVRRGRGRRTWIGAQWSRQT